MSDEAQSPEIGPKAMKMSKEDEEREARWRAQDDLRTLTEAEKIRGDAKRLAAAKKLAREEMKALKAAGGESDATA